MKKETKITVTSLSLGGMEFTADSVSLRRRRIYEIKLKAASPKPPNDNTVTQTAIDDMEQSKGKGIAGKDEKSAINELKDEDSE